LTGDPDLDIVAATASVSRYERRPGARLGEWSCTHNCDTSFLSKGAEVRESVLDQH